MNLTVRETSIRVHSEKPEVLLWNPQKIPSEDVPGFTAYGVIHQQDAPLEAPPLLQVGVVALPFKANLPGVVDHPSNIFGIVHTRKPGRKLPDYIRAQSIYDTWPHPTADGQSAIHLVMRIGINMSPDARAAKPERYHESAVLEETSNEALLRLPELVLHACVQMLEIHTSPELAHQ
jgi:hypothetical protein